MRNWRNVSVLTTTNDAPSFEFYKLISDFVSYTNSFNQLLEIKNWNETTHKRKEEKKKNDTHINIPANQSKINSFKMKCILVLVVY